MSTDPELVQAVQNMKDGLLRIFVTVIGVPKPEPEPLGASGDGSAKVHAGVLCDVCDQEIRGARYKCLQCEDYDLCEVCHAKKTHEQHDMLKLVNPGIVSFLFRFLQLYKFRLLEVNSSKLIGWLFFSVSVAKVYLFQNRAGHNDPSRRGKWPAVHVQLHIRSIRAGVHAQTFVSTPWQFNVCSIDSAQKVT